LCCPLRKFEFETNINDDQTVTVPKDVAAQIEQNRPVRVVVLVPDRFDEQQWNQVTADQFLKGYADPDAVYDDVSTR